MFPALFRPPPHDERGVDAAEAERIRQADVERVGNGFVGHVVQSALGVGIFEIHGGREMLIDQREHGDACFEAARAAEQVPGHRLRAADLEFAAQGVLAKDHLNRARFVAVARRRGRGVGVDVAHFFGLNAGVLSAARMLRCAPSPSGAMPVM